MLQIKGLLSSSIAKEYPSELGLIVESILDIDVEPTDSIHSSKGTVLKVLFNNETLEVIRYYFHEKETDRYLSFGMTEKEEEMLSRYLKELKLEGPSQ